MQIWYWDDSYCRNEIIDELIWTKTSNLTGEKHEASVSELSWDFKSYFLDAQVSIYSI